MPTFVFTAPDGKQKYTIKGPDGATQEQAFAILQQQLGAAPAAAQSPGDQVPGGGLAGNRNVGKPSNEPGDNLLGMLVSPIDAALSAGSAIAGAVAGPIAGVGKSIIDGKFGTAEGARQAEEFGSKVAGKIARPPATQTGRAILEAVGKVAEPMGALPTAELASLAGAAGNATRAVRGAAAASAAVQDAADAAAVATKGPSLRDLVRAPQQLDGVGAARASEAAQRAARAQALPVPIKLTKGQLTRDRAQVSFEREVAKQKEGEKLASHYEDQNAQFMQNLDAGVDMAGAESTSRRAVGKSVVSALEAKDAAKKAEIRDLYDQARTAGEMQQPVDVSGLVDWIAKNKGKDKLAPIISTIENEIKQNAKVEGGGLDNLTLTPKPKRTVMTLEASEDLRQAINKLAEPGTPNVVFGKDAKALIDAAQEGKGGDLFKQARRAYENYSNEFTNRDVVARLMRTKPGTKDRAVGLEDVADRSIISPAATTDDVRHLFRVLEAHPVGTDPAVVAAGQQAAKDLRGAVIDHIQYQMKKNVNADSTGARTGSPAKINSIVDELDADGKLEAIFGKKDAEKIRDLRDVAIDIYTSPSGTVNSSGTAAEMVRQGVMQKLGDIAAYGKAIPGVGPVAKYVGKQVTSATTRRKVRAALNPSLKDLTGGRN